MSTAGEEVRVVLCNCPPEQAAEIARAIVQRRLAACVNLLPGVRSIYRWEGEVCDDGETTLVVKTTGAGAAALCEALVELHPYDVPEVLALPVDAVGSHAPYLRWVADETGQTPLS
jgi:periplasmic divalent cation tolerance protein